MGPTASGKSALSLTIADRFPCEIISVDSALVYCGMDIGTAKPSPAILQTYPHYLIDIRDPAQSYSAAQFRFDALARIQAIHQAGKIALLVGGTMLYYKALQQGLADLPPADPAIRQQIDAQAQREGWPALHRRLALIDPESAGRIHPNDPQRLQRALEVYQITGKSLSDLFAEADKTTNPYRYINVILTPADRSQLHARIAMRFEHMLANGLIEEVAALYQRGDLHRDLPSMRSVGYRQVWDYLVGDYDATTLRTRGITATRQLAKRQLTWLRAWPDARTFACEEAKLSEQVIDHLAQTLANH